MKDYQGLALLIATIATSIATLAGVWSTVHNMRRKERVKLKISVQRGINILNSPTHNERKKYTAINVVNLGQVTIRIIKAGEVYADHAGSAIFSDSMRNLTELKYDEATDFVAEDGKREKPAYYYIQLRNGKTYKRYIQPRLWVWLRQLLHRLHIWQKKAL